MPEPLSRLLSSVAPATVAAHDDGRVVRYGDLDDLSRRAASGLKRLGIRPGDRVALWLPNTPAWLVLFFACAHIGAIAVSVNTRFRAHEVGDIVGRSGCRALAFWPGFRGIDFPAILAGIDPATLRGLEHLIVYGDDADAVVPGVPATGYDALTGADPDPRRGRHCRVALRDFHDLWHDQSAEVRLSHAAGCRRARA